MSMIHKLVKCAIAEIEMSEKYVHLAYKADDAAICAKLLEMAKEEMKHSDYLQTTAIKLVDLKKADPCYNGSADDDVERAFLEAYEGWKDKVKYSISTFEIKK